MFDIGWAELLIIGMVALIVVGPKDLPVMFQKMGQFFGRMRGMARDFQSAMNEAAEQSGVNSIKSSLNQVDDISGMIYGDAKDSLKAFQNEVSQVADPLAEHAKRVKQVEEANQNAEAFSKAYAAAQSEAEEAPQKKGKADPSKEPKKPRKKKAPASETAAKATKSAKSPQSKAAKSSSKKTKKQPDKS